MRKTSRVASVVLFISLCRAVTAATWYVAPPPLGSNLNPGTEEKPFATIQKGITVASNGDTVIVAEGKYVENIRFLGKNIIVRSTDPLDPNVVQKTIIDGNQVNSVVTFAGSETEDCVLSGFTIQNGKGQFDGKYGGGVYGAECHATIRNNIIARNRAPST